MIAVVVVVIWQIMRAKEVAMGVVKGR